jgi:hypothetical protein
MGTKKSVTKYPRKKHEKKTRGISREQIDFLFLLAIREFTRKATETQKDLLIKMWPGIPIREKGFEKALIEYCDSVFLIEKLMALFLRFMEDNGIMDFPIKYIPSRYKGHRSVHESGMPVQATPNLNSETPHPPTNKNLRLFNDIGNGAEARQPMVKVEGA